MSTARSAEKHHFDITRISVPVWSPALYTGAMRSQAFLVIGNAILAVSDELDVTGGKAATSAEDALITAPPELVPRAVAADIIGSVHDGSCMVCREAFWAWLTRPSISRDYL